MKKWPESIWHFCWISLSNNWSTIKIVANWLSVWSILAVCVCTWQCRGEWFSRVQFLKNNLTICSVNWISSCLPSHRPQPPALPRQRCGGDPLPDGGRVSRHGITEGVAYGPRSNAIPPGDHWGAGRQPRPQPGHHWRFQRPAAVEILPQLQPAAHIVMRAQGAVRPRFPPTATKRLIHFPKERFGLCVCLSSVCLSWLLTVHGSACLTPTVLSFR